VTHTALAQVVRRARPLLCAAEVPDFFAMLDEQARMAVSLARIVGEVLQGRESSHSLRLFDLEQRREELQRRNRAAVHAVHQLLSGVDEIRSTMLSLDRVAAGLFQTARAFHQLRLTPDEAGSRMLLVIEKAIESLQLGYARLANGSPAAEFDADAAIGSRDIVASYRSLGLEGAAVAVEQRLATAEDRFAACPETAPEASVGSRACWIDALYGNLLAVAHELAGAGATLRNWSRKLSVGMRDASTAAAMCALSPQQRLLS